MISTVILTNIYLNIDHFNPLIYNPNAYNAWVHSQVHHTHTSMFILINSYLSLAALSLESLIEKTIHNETLNRMHAENPERSYGDAGIALVFTTLLLTIVILAVQAHKIEIRYHVEDVVVFKTPFDHFNPLAPNTIDPVALNNITAWVMSQIKPMVNIDHFNPLVYDPNGYTAWVHAWEHSQAHPPTPPFITFLLGLFFFYKIQKAFQLDEKMVKYSIKYYNKVISYFPSFQNPDDPDGGKW